MNWPLCAITHRVTHRKMGGSFAMGFDGDGHLRGGNSTRLYCVICTRKHFCEAMRGKMAGPGVPAVGTKGALLPGCVPACLPVCQLLCLVLLSTFMQSPIQTSKQQLAQTNAQE